MASVSVTVCLPSAPGLAALAVALTTVSDLMGAAGAGPAVSARPAISATAVANNRRFVFISGSSVQGRGRAPGSRVTIRGTDVPAKRKIRCGRDGVRYNRRSGWDSQPERGCDMRCFIGAAAVLALIAGMGRADDPADKTAARKQTAEAAWAT